MTLSEQQREQLMLLSSAELRRRPARNRPGAGRLAVRQVIADQDLAHVGEIWAQTDERGRERPLMQRPAQVSVQAPRATLYLPRNGNENTRFLRKAKPPEEFPEPDDQEGVFAPQSGRQFEFLKAVADIVIYGGGAGSGKSKGALLDALREIFNPLYRAIFFRRNMTQVLNPGGLWDEAVALYSRLFGKPNEQKHSFTFPSGAQISFRHLEYENTKYQYQGLQVARLYFDELTHFTRSQFFYLVSRVRSVAGIKGAVRATTNADGDSWVAEFLQWWWDPHTGYPIPERAGKVRWMVMHRGAIFWADSPEELQENYRDIWAEDPQREPLSVAFIPAWLEDNKILVENDPGYRSRLDVQDEVERERLLNNNWLIRRSASRIFLREWFQFIPEFPAGIHYWFRTWDLAATEEDFRKRANRNPDYTATALGGVRYTRGPDGRQEIDRIFVQLSQARLAPAIVQELVHYFADIEPESLIAIEREPGAAGKILGEQFESTLARRGRNCVSYPARNRGSKTQAAILWSRLARQGRIVLVDSEPCEPYGVRAMEREETLRLLEHFPDPAYHDDIIDAVSLLYRVAFEALEGGDAFQIPLGSGQGEYDPYGEHENEFD